MSLSPRFGGFKEFLFEPFSPLAHASGHKTVTPSG
jgi:hypothetical protein